MGTNEHKPVTDGCHFFLASPLIRSRTTFEHSLRSPEEAGKRLEESVARHKFGVLHVHDLNKTLESKGIELGSECRIYDVCNLQAATKALQIMRISTVLPCRISVSTEGDDSSIATVTPTSLFSATGLMGAEGIAAEVEREILAIIDEAAE